MPKTQVKRKPNGMGSFEFDKNGRVRLVKMVSKKYQKGPWSESQKIATLLWNEKFLNPRIESEGAGSLPLSRIGSLLFPVVEPKELHPLRAEALRRWRSPSSRACYSRHWRASINGSMIEHVRPVDLDSFILQRWIDEMTQSPKTIKNRVMLLGVVLKICGLEMPPIYLPKIPPARRSVATGAQIPDILALAHNDEEEMTLRLLLLGARRSEVIALRREDYQQVGGHWGFQIRYAVVEDEFGRLVEKDLKTSESYRFNAVVDPRLHDLVIAIDAGYLLSDANRLRPIHPQTMNYRLAKIARRAKEKLSMSPSMFRRTIDTLFVQNQSKVSLKVAARHQGHSIETMLKIYAQVSEEMLAEGMTSIMPSSITGKTDSA
jgi:integrase